MSEPLLPCPFCGGEARHMPESSFKGILLSAHEIRCNGCAVVVVAPTARSSEALAAAAWNRRAPRQEVTVREVWDASTGEIERTVGEAHFEPVPEKSWRSPDGRYSYDMMVMKWPPESHLRSEGD